MCKLASILLLLVPFNLLAALCEIKSGDVVYGYERKQLERNIQIDECPQTVYVTSGTAEICQLNNLGQWNCDELQGEPNQKIELAQLKIGKDYNDSFWSTLKGLFTPDKKTKYGGKRLKEGDYLRGLPYGSILKPDATLTLSTRFSLNQVISEFTLVDAKTTTLIYRGQPGSTEVTFDGQALLHGSVYKWSMKVPGQPQPYEGEFSVAEEIDQQEFEQELADACNENKLNGTAIKIMRAAIVKDYGYTFDYFMAIEDVRSQLLTTN